MKPSPAMLAIVTDAFGGAAALRNTIGILSERRPKPE
jgi:hypothetical protein